MVLESPAKRWFFELEGSIPSLSVCYFLIFTDLNSSLDSSILAWPSPLPPLPSSTLNFYCSPLLPNLS